ncbi:MAG: trypsin-like peptidase domain-containing protein [Eubacteriales bacterium]|nr:trypsin-like peptidase domain-containing protein [Eubacteriales bacterium]
MDKDNKNESLDKNENIDENPLNAGGESRSESCSESCSESKDNTGTEGLSMQENTDAYAVENTTPTDENRTSHVEKMNNINYVWDGEKFVRHKRKAALRALTLTVVIALIISVIGLTAALMTHESYDNGDVSDLSQTDSSDNASSAGDTSSAYENSGSIKITPVPASDNIGSLSELYDACAPSCCSIYIPLQTGYTLGSGFVIDAEEGYIVTNNHVVEENNGTIEVKFYDGTTYNATLVGRDELTDIAVLKIEAEGLTALELGDSSAIKVGDQVIAIGTPYDLSLAGTLTNGVISGVDRDIELTNDYGKVVKTMKLLQTNSSINPGNSGGPLINMHGQVIGINTLKLMDEFEGLGFAIPMSYAVIVINNLIDYGEVRDDSGLVKAAAKLNVTVFTYPTSDSYTREKYDLPDSIPEGVLVIEISRNTAIYKAGLEIYDIITEFNGTVIKSYSDLTTELAKYSAGKQVTLKVYRMNRWGDGDYVDITFKLDGVS